jgi:hypothetical protein
MQCNAMYILRISPKYRLHGKEEIKSKRKKNSNPQSIKTNNSDVKHWTVMMGRRLLDSRLVMIIESRFTCVINMNIFNTLQNKNPKYI